MSIPARNPRQIPASEAVTYDSWIVKECRFLRIDNLTVSAFVVVKLGRERNQGNQGEIELLHDSQEIPMGIPNIYAPASNDYPAGLRNRLLTAFTRTEEAIEDLMEVRNLR